jgi:hypothetical protein
MSRDLLEIYPWRKIWPRWLLGLGEIGLSIYFVIRFNTNLGLFYGAWWGFSLFALLPLIRCCHCHYYGKRCNTAWGLLAGFAFGKGEAKYFQSGYGLTMLLWPLRFVPIVFGLSDLMGAIGGEFVFNPNGLFVIYLMIIIIHRWYYRTANCPSCFQKSQCPVYNPRILANPPDSGFSDSD